jgi:hypothetical protein
MTSRRSLTFGVLALISGFLGCGWFDVSSTEPDPQSMDADVLDAAPEAGSSSPDDPPDADMDVAWMDDPPDAGAEAGAEAGPLDPPDYPPLDADLRWHPEPRRLSMVDDSPEPFENSRAWLLVHGGDTRHRLVSYRIDRPGEPWFDTGIADVTSSPKALLWYLYHGGNEYSQRVFFSRAGKLQMLRYGDADLQPDEDGGVVDPLVSIDVELAGGYTISGRNLAVEVVGPLYEEVIVVVAPALLDGVAGYFCVFKSRVDASAEADSWSAECSQAEVFTEGTELASTVYGDRMFVFGAGADGSELVLLQFPHDGDYFLTSYTAPNEQAWRLALGASLVLVAPAIEMLWIPHLYAATQDGRVWHATYDAMTSQLAWTALPALPPGVRASTSDAAINAMDVFPNGSPQSRSTVLSVLGDDGTVYYNEEPWRQEWDRVPSPGRDQVTLALGGIAGYVPSLEPEDFRFSSTNLSIVGGAHATTLQEMTEVGGEMIWKDHVRADASSAVAVAALAGAESSVASSADIGIAATALRGPSGPFEVTVSGTLDNASSWHSSALKTLPAEHPIDAPASALAPITASDSKRLHLVNLESDLDTDCLSPSDSQRVVYRRGEDVRVLAQLAAEDPDLFLLASSGRYSDPSLVVTESTGPVEDRESTAHALWNDLNDERVHYWRLPPLGEPYATALDPTWLPISSLRLISGAFGQAIYAAAGGPQHLRICDLNLLPLDDESCVFVAFGQLSLRYAEISFGAPEPAAQGRCEPIEDQHFKCMRDGQPFAVAGDHRIANKLYVVYAAEDTAAGLDVERGSIFFTYSTGGSKIGDWSDPVRVNPRATGETREYFDAELAVDAQGGVFVTYAAIDPQSADTTVRVYAAYWDGEGTPRFDAATQVASWDASLLPYDCTTDRWALGDYRDPDTIGGRSLHVLRDGDGDSARQVTRWLSRYAPP